MGWGLSAYRQVGRSLACSDEWVMTRCAGLAREPPTLGGPGRARCFWVVRHVGRWDRAEHVLLMRGGGADVPGEARQG